MRTRKISVIRTPLEFTGQFALDNVNEVLSISLLICRDQEPEFILGSVKDELAEAHLVRAYSGHRLFQELNVVPQRSEDETAQDAAPTQLCYVRCEVVMEDRERTQRKDSNSRYTRSGSSQPSQSKNHSTRPFAQSSNSTKRALLITHRTHEKRTTSI
jgi:hypothetical protein